MTRGFSLPNFRHDGKVPISSYKRSDSHTDYQIDFLDEDIKSLLVLRTDLIEANIIKPVHAAVHFAFNEANVNFIYDLTLSSRILVRNPSIAFVVNPSDPLYSTVIRTIKALLSDGGYEYRDTLEELLEDTKRWQKNLGYNNPDEEIYIRSEMADRDDDNDSQDDDDLEASVDITDEVTDTDNVSDIDTHEQGADQDLEGDLNHSLGDGSLTDFIDFESVTDSETIDISFEIEASDTDDDISNNFNEIEFSEVDHEEQDIEQNKEEQDFIFDEAEEFIFEDPIIQATTQDDYAYVQQSIAVLNLQEFQPRLSQASPAVQTTNYENTPRGMNTISLSV